MMLDKIIECEKAYRKNFGDTYEYAGFTRFRDEGMKDMYSHNFTFMLGNDGEFTSAEIVKLVEGEIAYRKQEGADYCQLNFHMPVGDDVVGLINPRPEVERLRFYYIDTADCGFEKDIRVKKLECESQIEDIFNIAYAEDGDDLGEDFCRNRANRQAEVYLSAGGVNAYILYVDGVAVAKCEFFIYPQAEHAAFAKIEDFVVLPSHQRMGYGSAMLRHLIATAKEDGVRITYLQTDYDGTAHEMYTKFGFSAVSDGYEVVEFLFQGI